MLLKEEYNNYQLQLHNNYLLWVLATQNAIDGSIFKPFGMQQKDDKTADIRTADDIISDTEAYIDDLLNKSGKGG